MRPRATVMPKFIDLVCELALKEMQDIKTQSEAYGNKRAFLMSKGQIIRRLSGLARKDEQALDRLKTNLRGLDYSFFDAYTRKDITYLVGVTNDVIIGRYSNDNSKKPSDYFNAGPYLVYVNADQFLAKNVDKTHMIPKRDPKTRTRHPHIHCMMASGTHPLDGIPKNCWSGFAMLVSGAADDQDIASLFRYIHLYLGRWAKGKEWGTNKKIPFIVDHPVENYAH